MKQSDLKMALEQLHLVEAILDRHGLDGPATHKRNSTSIPIDRIWKTQGLQIKRGGYFGYNEVFMNADHRCLWLDLAFTSAFGHDLPLARKITPKRLHCKDPRLVDNFINLYHKTSHRSSSILPRIERGSYEDKSLATFSFEGQRAENQL